MSMLSRPASGGSGGGITAEQYAGLTQDAELSAAIDAINAHTNWATNGVAAGIQSILYSGAYLPSGSLVLTNRPSGEAAPGFRRVSGFGVPADFFAQARTVMLPYTVGANGMTSNGAATGRIAVLDDSAFCFSGALVRKFTLGTMAWADLPSFPLTATPPTAVGTAGGKLFATGCTLGASTSTASYLFDPVANAWSQTANQPTFLCEQGVADLGAGRVAVFGGKTNAVGASTTAATLVDTVRIFDANTETFSAPLAAFPVRLSIVRTARRPNGSVFVWPRQTSDGTTLVSTGNRRIWLWAEGSAAVELDPLPEAVSVACYLFQVRADGKLVFVPAVAPTAGARARLLDPTAPAGSQWSDLEWDMNANATYVDINAVGAGGVEQKLTPSGFAFTAQTVATSVSGLSATYIAPTSVNWSDSFYQQRVE